MTASSAKLFYGYLEPEREDPEQETAWDVAHATSKQGCTVGIYGSGDTLRCYLAIEASLREARSATAIEIPAWSMQVKAAWQHWLLKAANEFGLDVRDLTPDWYLVSLYTY
jgi:hypothetical protein